MSLTRCLKVNMNHKRRINISVPVREGMACYPSDPPIKFEHICSTENGDAANVMRISLCTHTGTHFDAPFHFFSDGKKADEYPADFFIGRARVIALSHSSDIKRSDLSNKDIAPDDIVLLKTRNSAYMTESIYCSNHVNVLACAAEFLVKKRIRALGFDYLTIEEDREFPAHRILLGAGIPIIEGLLLSGVKEGLYKMTAMFINIRNGDGAPISALLEEY